MTYLILESFGSDNEYEYNYKISTSVVVRMRISVAELTQRGKLEVSLSSTTRLEGKLVLRQQLRVQVHYYQSSRGQISYWYSSELKLSSDSEDDFYVGCRNQPSTGLLRTTIAFIDNLHWVN